jgi:hypothetical protein
MHGKEHLSIQEAFNKSFSKRQRASGEKMSKKNVVGNDEKTTLALQIIMPIDYRPEEMRNPQEGVARRRGSGILQSSSEHCHPMTLEENLGKKIEIRRRILVWHQQAETPLRDDFRKEKTLIAF